jgi:hypothetical protein
MKYLYESCKNLVSLGEIYGLSCCACEIRNAFSYETKEENVYITAGPVFGASLHGKNLIID